MDQWLEPVVFIIPEDVASDAATRSPGHYHIRVELGTIDLNAGKYSLVISVEDEVSSVRLARLQGYGKFRVTSDLVHWARIVRKAPVFFEPA